ncbi:MAG: DUF6356 family protein [Pseudomonadota bacterium]
MLTSVFLHHPRAVGETYIGHMAFAGWFAGKLLLAASAAIIHAVLPCLFERTASTIIAELYERTQHRTAE